MRNFLAILFFVFLLNNISFSQTLTSDGDYDVSATTYPGFIRGGINDVHSPTGVVVYVYYDPDASGQGVFCKIYNEQMTLIKSQFQVNVSTTNIQTNAFIKINEPDNSFLVIWSSNHSGNYDVYMRKYDLYGNALTGEVQVNDANIGTQYAVRLAFDYSRNEAVVLYRDDAGQDGSGLGVYAKRFNYSNLNPIGSQFRINQSITTSNQVPGDIGINQSNGDLIVLWRSNHSGNYDIYKSVFTYNGSSYVSASEAKINVYSSGDQYYEYLSINQTTGEYVTVWGSGGGDGSGWAIYAQIFDSGHSQVKSEFQVNSDWQQNQTQPKAVWIESVNQIVFFFHYMYSGYSTIKYRIFDGLTTPGQYTAVANDAAAIGEPNTYDLWAWSNFAAHYNSYDHKIFLSYELYNSNWTYDSRVKTRKFSFTHPDLNPVSTTLTSGADIDVSPATFPGYVRAGITDVDNSTGKVITVYADNDASGQGVFFKIYDEDLNLLVGPQQVNTTTTGNQYSAFVKVHQDNNSFIVAWGSMVVSGNMDIYMRKYDLNGTALTSEIQVNSDAGNQYWPKIAFDYSRNEMVLVFRDDSGLDGSGNGAYAKRYDYSSLSVISNGGLNQFRINQSTTNHQAPTDMGIVQSTGDLIVVYRSNQISSNGYDTYKTVFSYNSGTNTFENPVETQVNNYVPNDQDLAALSINQTTGDYVICWGSNGLDGSGWANYAKIYSSSHAIVKNDFRVNSDPVNNQNIPRVIWEESIDNLVFFFNYNAGSTSTLKYRIFGKTSSGDYFPLNNDTDAIGGQNVANFYWNLFYPAYNSNNHTIYLAYDILNNFAANSKLKLKKFGLDNPELEAASTSSCSSVENDLNWTQDIYYDENGVIIGENRRYFDKIGRPTQVQVKDLENNSTLIAATLYDTYGVPVIQTLPASVNNTCFEYDLNFITYDDYTTFTTEKYDYHQFDLGGTGTVEGDIDNPIGISPDSDLGQYYSFYNTDEPYIPDSEFPYYRNYYNRKVSGGVQRSTSPGEELKMGGGKEVKTFVAPILNELDHYMTLRNSYMVSGGSSATTLAYRGHKTIYVDENGVESIVFTDLSGKILAKAISDGTTNTAVSGTIAAPGFYYYNMIIRIYT